MSNELINTNELGFTHPEESKALAELSKNSSYLPQLRIYGSQNDVVKEGNFPIGHLGLSSSKDKIADLGEVADMLIIDYRSRASIVMSGDQPVNYYTIDSDNFQDVKNRALAKVESHLAGLEYLVYIPLVEQFGLFFMGNSTLRRESDNVKAHVGKAITLKVKFIKGKKYSWHGVEVLSCDTPFNVPPKEEIISVHEEHFANPKDSVVDLVNNASDERAR